MQKKKTIEEASSKYFIPRTFLFYNHSFKYFIVMSIVIIFSILVECYILMFFKKKKKIIFFKIFTFLKLEEYIF